MAKKMMVDTMDATISWTRVEVMTHFRAMLRLGVRELDACFLRHPRHKNRMTALQVRRFKFR
jgi:hypothetical protein